MTRIPLKEGRNTFLFRDSYGKGEVFVDLWCKREDHPIGRGELYIEAIDVAQRAERGETWGPPMLRSPGD
jgi:hypothetical protein